jgi:rfaE bifunctional protein kinase chain/domain
MQWDLDRYREIVARFEGRKIAVVGDIVADVFVYGMPERLSREAPVMIVKYEREEIVPGSAANTAHNLAALGAEVYPVGVIGSDAMGKRLMEVIAGFSAHTGGIKVLEEADTVTKMRILAGDSHTRKQQVLRIDRGEEADVPPAVVAWLAERMGDLQPVVEGWIVSDYGYKLVRGEILEKLAEISRSWPVVADSRFRIRAFGGVTIATPNESEAAAAVGRRIETGPEALAVGAELHRILGSRALLLTRGNQGMILFEEGCEPVSIPIAGSDDIVDVSGAGDTVCSTVALSLASGASFLEAARIANYAAGVVVMKRGTATASREELLTLIERDLGSPE